MKRIGIAIIILLTACNSFSDVVWQVYEGTEVVSLLYDPTPVMTPTALPTPHPMYMVGMIAEVNTIDGEVLYLRDAPTTGGEIVVYLYDRMIVEVLAGPVDADGYTWWQIRTDDGDEGWAAQAVGTVTTLLPAERED